MQVAWVCSANEKPAAGSNEKIEPLPWKQPPQVFAGIHESLDKVVCFIR